jgi:hypothetical protein
LSDKKPAEKGILFSIIEPIAIIGGAIYAVAWLLGYADDVTQFGSRNRFAIGLILIGFAFFNYICIDMKRFEQRRRFEKAREKGRSKGPINRSQKGNRTDG